MKTVEQSYVLLDNKLTTSEYFEPLFMQNEVFNVQACSNFDRQWV